jgi:hypothetical protein
MLIIWRKYVHATKKNMEVLHDADKDDGLEANTGQRKHILTCLHLNDRLCGLVVTIPGYRSGGPG